MIENNVKDVVLNGLGFGEVMTATSMQSSGRRTLGVKDDNQFYFYHR